MRDWESRFPPVSEKKAQNHVTSMNTKICPVYQFDTRGYCGYAV